MDPSGKKRKGEENGAIPSTRLTPMDARKIIESFSREQLLDIVQDAVCRHSDVLDAARAIADQDLAQRKLFIRGLGWETTAEGLRSLFSAYGELEEAVVIIDKATGKSKGYGFITFRHVDGALLALKEPSKRIDGRMAVSQLAVSGAAGASASTGQTPATDVSFRKIYVGNVPYDISSERLLSHFSSYGEIEEGPLGFDKQTGKSRGFALFVYKTAEGARASLANPSKVIDGHAMVCKLASDGKKGKSAQPEQPSDSSKIGGGIQNQPSGLNLVMQPRTPGLTAQFSMPGSLPSYPGYSGPGIQVPGSLTHHQHPSSSISASTGIGTTGVSVIGAQGVSLSSGNGAYGNVYSSQFGALTPGVYGGMSGPSLFRTAPNSVVMPSAYQQNGSSAAPRGQPGGIYPGAPPQYF